MQPCKALLAGAAVTVCLAAGAAWSQDKGPYIGGSLGRSEMKDACEGVAISCDKTDKAWKIFGGYQFNRNLAAGLAYTDLGETKASGGAGRRRGQRRPERCGALPLLGGPDAKEGRACGPLFFVMRRRAA